MTTKKTETKQRVVVEPGIYRRGDVHEVRVTAYDTAGKRRSQWKTVGKSIRQARTVRDQARADASRKPLPPATRHRNLTVRAFFTDYFLPYIDEERVNKAGTLHKNTAVLYHRYANTKVIPTLGDKPIDQVTTGDIERLLNNLGATGRHAGAGRGRPRQHPKWVYDRIASPSLTTSPVCRS